MADTPACSPDKHETLPRNGRRFGHACGRAIAGSVIRANSCENGTAGSAVAVNGLIVNIEGVFDPSVQLQGVGEGKRGVQIHQRVARQTNAVRGVVETRSDVTDTAAGRDPGGGLPGEMRL